ncbi:MAG: hypothetical protein QME64_09765, partial [bacterium]|nr:hypothetical protein [bacterium]
MIKINLLPLAVKGKKVGRIPLILLLTAIITIIVILPFYFYSKITVSRLESKKTTLEQQIKEL